MFYKKLLLTQLNIEKIKRPVTVRLRVSAKREYLFVLTYTIGRHLTCLNFKVHMLYKCNVLSVYNIIP